jgi:DNA polymerase III delta subunit
MSQPLTIEQEFTLKTFENQIEKASPEQLKDMLKTLYRMHFQMQNNYKEIIKNSWGIE